MMNEKYGSSGRVSHSIKIALGFALAGAVAFPAATQAATNAQKQAAIDSGLAWLVTQQQANGKWIYNGGSGDVAATGAALLAFIEEGNTPTSGTYSTNVTNGLNYLFSNAQSAGVGLRFGPNDNNQVYNTGLVLPAIIKAAPLSTVISSTNPLVNGKTYGQVVQSAIDYLADAQNDTGTGGYAGGWRYTPNYGSSDNSVSQWPALAGLYAQGAGITWPTSVKNLQLNWIDYSQNDTTGGLGYIGPNDPTPLRTGSGLVQMSAAGLGTSSSRVQNALTYINNNWKTFGTGGTFGDYYGMWAVYKGLESTIGLDDTTTITNLFGQGTNPLDPGSTWNWWEEFSQYLVDHQNGSDYWSGGTFGSESMQTAWAINMLQATQIPGPEPEKVPEPTSVLGLLAIGALGAGSALTRKLLK